MKYNFALLCRTWIERVNQNKPTRFHPCALEHIKDPSALQLTICHTYSEHTQQRQIKQRAHTHTHSHKAFNVSHRTPAECDPAPAVYNLTSKLFFFALTWVLVHYKNRLNKIGQGLAAKTAIICHPSTLSCSLPAPGRAPLQHSPQEWGATPWTHRWASVNLTRYHVIN